MILVLEHIQHLHDEGVLQRPVFSSNYEEGILTSGCAVGCVPFMEGKNDITNHPDVLNVIENSYLYHIFTCIFNGVAPVSFDFKWLRGMHQGGNTGCHLDRVYMNRGSSKLLTCWIPLDNLPIDMGVLAVLEGSHRLDRSADDGYTKLQNTYANMDVDRDRLQGTGWFTEDPMEFYRFNNPSSSHSNPIWKTTGYYIENRIYIFSISFSLAFSAGDILIFTMRTIHMSSVNLTNKLRLSCDTRWQPSNEPLDPRFVLLETNKLLGHAEAKFGVYAKNAGDVEEGKTTMEQWRKKWGFHSGLSLTT